METNPMPTTKPTLKLQKLPDLTPSKMTITITPDLQADLESYAKIYERTYEDKQNVSSLIPSMLAGFLASDAGFKKAKRELA